MVWRFVFLFEFGAGMWGNGSKRGFYGQYTSTSHGLSHPDHYGLTGEEFNDLQARVPSYSVWSSSVPSTSRERSLSPQRNIPPPTKMGDTVVPSPEIEANKDTARSEDNEEIQPAFQGVVDKSTDSKFSGMSLATTAYVSNQGVQNNDFQIGFLYVTTGGICY